MFVFFFSSSDLLQFERLINREDSTSASNFELSEACFIIKEKRGKTHISREHQVTNNLKTWNEIIDKITKWIKCEKGPLSSQLCRGVEGKKLSRQLSIGACFQLNKWEENNKKNTKREREKEREKKVQNNSMKKNLFPPPPSFLFENKKKTQKKRRS